MHHRILGAALLSVAALSAQTISIGVKGGAVLTEPTAYPSDESRRYTVGPSIEVRLTERLSVEGNALYKRIGGTLELAPFLPPGNQTQFLRLRDRGHSWEFPILGKFSFRDRDARVNPFLSTGYAFRKVWLTNESTFRLGLPDGEGSRIETSRGDLSSPLNVGAVFGGGVQWKVGRFGVSPEVRYTRWGGGGVGNFTSSRNQAELLLGIRF